MSVHFANDMLGRIQAITSNYELSDLSHPNVPRFASFREEIRAFATGERLSYQDDATMDPAASVLPPLEETPGVAAARSQAPVADSSATAGAGTASKE